VECKKCVESSFSHDICERNINILVRLSGSTGGQMGQR
jgi:hypothetical protein